jgi:hypothetical protein
MKKFLDKYFVIIVFTVLILGFFRSCGDSRELTAIKKEIQLIKDNTYDKSELDLIIRIEGLKSELRMIQSTDRKIFDLNRQTEITKQLQELESKLK